MAIISFWSEGDREAGKTASLAAIATQISIDNTYKTLIFNAEYNDSSLEECFWPPKKPRKEAFMLGNRADLATGTTGVAKAILSNKTSPEIIKYYTKTIYKDRLELLTEDNITQEDYQNQRRTYKEIAKIANRYYNLVLVDISGSPEESITRSILEESDIVVVNLPQNIKKINEYLELKRTNKVFNTEKTIVLIGRCDKNSKYNAKNLSRQTNIRDLYPVPYNTQFLEAINEGKITEFFTKFRGRIHPDENTYFLEEVKKNSERILEKLKELQMRT
ncbi:MAG: hypothetical protein U0M00_01205 [Clostridia bacterium]|jgi:MinD-like ATPase involved in chromosome partitioning or flagellar assembly|nr:hypothetical protein [Clostridia bacterium]